MLYCKNICLLLTNAVTVVHRRTIKVLPYRKPIAVYSKKEYETYLSNKTKKKQKRIIKVKNPPKGKSLESLKYTQKSNFSEELLGLKYKKLRNVPGNVINRMLYDMGTLRQRPNPHLCLLTHSQTIDTALKADNFVKNIYFNRLHKLKTFPVESLDSVHLTHIPDRILKDLPHSCQSGLFAVSAVQGIKTRSKVLSNRKLADRKKLIKLIPLTVVCENIKSVEEMGKILKYAESFGCLQVYIMDNCVDAWGTEVLEIAEGAHFKLPVLTDLTWDSFDKLKFGDKFYMVHFDKSGLKLTNFASKAKLESYNKSSRIVDMLQKESKHGTLSKSKESDFYLPPVDCSETNLLVPGLLVIGNTNIDVFHYAANASFSNHCALNLPESTMNSISSQLEYILQEAQKQRNK